MRFLYFEVNCCVHPPKSPRLLRERVLRVNLRDLNLREGIFFLYNPLFNMSLIKSPWTEWCICKMCEVCENEEPTIASALANGKALFLVTYIHKRCASIRGSKWIEANSLSAAHESIEYMRKENPVLNEYDYFISS